MIFRHICASYPLILRYCRLVHEEKRAKKIKLAIIHVHSKEDAICITAALSLYIHTYSNRFLV